MYLTKRDALVAMRMPSQTRDALRVAAKADGRSMSDVVVRAVESWLRTQPIHAEDVGG